MTGTKLFLAACSRSNKEIPYKNFQRSVLDGVGPADHELINDLGYVDPIPVWGISEGQRSSWDDLNPGDVVLFYTKKRLYTHMGKLVEKAESEDFALEIWQQGDERQLNTEPDAPRPLLLLLDEIKRIDIPAPELHERLGYELDYLFGGSKKPASESLDKIKEEYGSLEAYIRSHLDRGQSASPKELENAVQELYDAVRGVMTREKRLGILFVEAR